MPDDEYKRRPPSNYEERGYRPRSVTGGYRPKARKPGEPPRPSTPKKLPPNPPKLVSVRCPPVRRPHE